MSLFETLVFSVLSTHKQRQGPTHTHTHTQTLSLSNTRALTNVDMATHERGRGVFEITLIEHTQHTENFVDEHMLQQNHSILNPLQSPSIHNLGVNFINVKRTRFSYKMLFWQLFSSYMYIKKRRSYKKFVRKILMKLTVVRTIM